VEVTPVVYEQNSVSPIATGIRAGQSYACHGDCLFVQVEIGVRLAELVE
jgi:hypothetical protein